MRKFLIVVFACIALAGLSACKEDAPVQQNVNITGYPVTTPAQIEAALKGKWEINITKIDTLTTGDGGEKFATGTGESTAEVVTVSGEKAISWRGLFGVDSYTMSAAGNRFEGEKVTSASYFNRKQYITGEFVNSNYWTGTYTYRYTATNAPTKPTGRTATFTATRK